EQRLDPSESPQAGWRVPAEGLCAPLGQKVQGFGDLRPFLPQVSCRLECPLQGAIDRQVIGIGLFSLAYGDLRLETGLVELQELRRIPQQLIEHPEKVSQAGQAAALEVPPDRGRAFR